MGVYFGGKTFTNILKFIPHFVIMRYRWI